MTITTSEAPALPGNSSADGSLASGIPSSTTLRAIIFMVGSLVFFSLMDALVKDLGSRYSTLQIVFFRSFFAFVPLGILIYRTGWADAVRIRNYKGHALRILVGVTAMFCFFYAFAHMPLADVVAISFAAPIFVVALSVPLLGEKVGPWRWTAVLIGFAGVLIMVNPGAGMLDPTAIIALIGTVFFALAMIVMRKLGRTESGASVVLTFTLSCTLLSGLALPFVWVTPNLLDLACLVAIGLLGGVGQILMTFAFKHGDVAVVAPFEYTAILWASLLGFLFWDEIPGLNIWIGAGVVMVSGLFILFREANLKLPRGHARRLQTKR